MGTAVSFLIVLLAVFALVVMAGIGVLALVRLGVITRYALQEEPTDTGDYGLDQSQESGVE